MQSTNDSKKPESSEFVDALKKGALLGLGILVLVLPAMYVSRKPPPAAPPVAQVQPAPAPAAQTPPAAQPAAPAEPAAPAAPPPHLADFGSQKVSDDVKLVANWAAWTRDHKKNSFVVIDKKDAQLYVFDPQARLQGSTPILLGKAKGDDSAPGIGSKPLPLVEEHEKTTPAGRFTAELGKNLEGEDIIWVDYDSAVSMHRVRKVAEKERRYERLASATKRDNRISFGCINIPFAFYDGILDPAVKKTGAIVYVLPDQKSIEQVFGAYDVTKGTQVAQRP